MSTVTLEEPQSIREPIADTLVQSVVVMLIMTLVQRLVGLARSVLFCRTLDLEQLGQWDVAFSFLNLAAPLAVLGLPGSFGRYLEHYRQRGQLRTFLTRTTAVCGLSVLLAVGVLLLAPSHVSQFVFGRPDDAHIVAWLAVAVAALAFHNFTASLLIGLRRFRLATVMQFLQSLAFAIVATTLLVGVSTSLESVLGGFTGACLLSTIACLVWMRRGWRGSPSDVRTFPQRGFWSRIAPFAIWVWVTNLLSGLFEVVDRYMLIHFSSLPNHEALAQVGHYHSSRIIPMLFMSVAAMLGAAMTPHLSHDWEAGRRREVAARLNLALKCVLLAMFATSTLVLAVAPWLFEAAFSSKFSGGLAVLPWTLAYFTWFGVFTIAQNYLWCAENARLGSVALLAGLGLNVALNLVLLPHYELQGAVWATSAANFLALALVYLFSARAGMRFHRGTLLLSLAPCALPLGPVGAAAVLLAIVLSAVLGNQLFHRDEKLRIAASLREYTARLVRRNARSAGLT